MKTKRTANKLTTESGFHVIRALTIDHNIRRLRAHLERISRTPDQHRWLRANRLKKRIRAMRAGA